MRMIGKEKTENLLVENVRQIIGERFSHWVLFENGTYILFEDIPKTNKAALRNHACRLMQEFGPIKSGVYTSSSDEVVHLKDMAGWLVLTTIGMYTYIHPNEFKEAGKPSELAIFVKGMNKRCSDSENLNIIHINCPIF